MNIKEKIKNDNLYIELMKIKERPGMFLGEKSFKTLVHFIWFFPLQERIKTTFKYEKNNYFDIFDIDNILNKSHERGLTSECSTGFEKFVKEELGFIEGLTVNWNNVIELNYIKDDLCFDKFYQLFDKYISKMMEKYDGVDYE